jgi:uncharacterized protein (DUF1697 family)
MPRYVALLRGINVGGNNMIKMEKLRETFAALGFENVKTYINSGNIAFDAKKTSDAKLAKKIHDTIENEFGFNISVMVRSADDLAKVLKANPYLGKFDDDRYLHVFFLENELTAEQAELLMEQANENEFITADGRTIYYMLKISILDSALGKGFLDKKLKIPSTARNWRTVGRIATL